MYISAWPIVKGSSEGLPQAIQMVEIGLERLQCRLQNPKDAKNGQNLALWLQNYMLYYQKLIDTAK